MRNDLPSGFLSTYRTGKPHSTLYVRLARGYLRLKYGLNDAPDALSIVSYVLSDSDESPALGARLELRLPESAGEEVVTFIAENAVSGRQWARGRASWGHTYEADSADAGEAVGLEEWVDRCIAEMISTPRGSPHKRKLRREGWFGPDEI